jgi:hypothetical protein
LPTSRQAVSGDNVGTFVAAASPSSCPFCGTLFPSVEPDIETLASELEAPILGSPLAAIYVPVFVAIGTAIVSLIVLLLLRFFRLLTRFGPTIVVLAMVIIIGVGPLLGLTLWVRSRARLPDE